MLGIYTLFAYWRGEQNQPSDLFLNHIDKQRDNQQVRQKAFNIRAFLRSAVTNCIPLFSQDGQAQLRNCGYLLSAHDVPSVKSE